MTTSDPAGHPDRAYVWVWLPEATEPVVAGRLDDRGAVVAFTYARSYLERAEPMALFHWDEVCDIAGTSRADKELLWGRQFLNPYALEGYRP